MRRRSVLFETLEARKLFSGYTPAQIETAYGFNQITFNGGTVAGNGAGQTIALMEVGNDATLNTDLQNFDAAYGLNNPGSSWCLSVVGEDGGAVPTVAATQSQQLETALDLEWAHAIAPAANILVVEANTSGGTDLYRSEVFASAAPGVSTVSISYTRPEAETDTTYLGTAQAPGHNGVTFVAASGDNGFVSFPSNISNVVGVGGTSLTLGTNGQYAGETVWNNQYGRSGGEPSLFIPEPTYQLGVQKTGTRTTADVSFDADPLTGFDTYFNGSTTPVSVGGTSAGAPAWAALFAIADQGRELNGLDTLDSGTQTLPMLYDLVGTPLYAQAFNDVTTGSNGFYSAGPGYDYPTGLGTPKANVLVQYLAGNISIPEPATLAIAVALMPIILKRPHRQPAR